MPALKGKKKQLSTEESNASRFETKIRWVVESVHGILGQKYKILHHQFRNQNLPNSEVICKTACLLLNETGKLLYTDAGKLEKILEIMKLRRNKKNTLAERVETNNWNQKTLPFQKITSNDLLDFPELTIEDLEFLFTGSYQLSQAISYLGEMLENGVLIIGFLKQEPYVFKFEVRSRHIAA